MFPKDINLSDYIAERKYNGERIIAIKQNDIIKLQRKNGVDVSHLYPEIIKSLQTIEYDIILDGEVITYINGIDDFENGLKKRYRLKNDNKIYIKSLEMPVVYAVFDILKMGIPDLTQKSLYERKEHLQHFYEKDIKGTNAENYIELVEIYENKEEIITKAKNKNWKGVIIKNKYSMYSYDSNDEWFVIDINKKEEN